MNYGLYLHIPFCQQHCHYCAFPISLAGPESHPAYVRRLRLELELAGLSSEPTTVYLGGGTPSLLAADLLEEVLEPVRLGEGEVTLEANPGTLDSDRLDRYQALGINRVSLGAQSFDTMDLRRMGRLHAVQDTVDDFDRLRRYGFDNINLDLIAGFVGQDEAAWNENLEWVDRLRPEHVSIYLLEVDEGHFWRTTSVPLPTDEDHARFYTAAAEKLDSAGYRHYEVSNWALPGRECLHNRGYWNFRPYRGIGLGAHSFTGGRRFWNTRSMSDYAARLDRGELPIEAAEDPSPRTRIEEAYLLGLRQLEGLDVFQIARELEIAYPQEWYQRVDALQRAGLVAFDGARLNLTSSGWLLAGGVTEELLCQDLLSICEATR